MRSDRSPAASSACARSLHLRPRTASARDLPPLGRGSRARRAARASCCSSFVRKARCSRATHVRAHRRSSTAPSPTPHSVRSRSSLRGNRDSTPSSRPDSSAARSSARGRRSNRCRLHFRATPSARRYRRTSTRCAASRAARRSHEWLARETRRREWDACVRTDNTFGWQMADGRWRMAERGGQRAERGGQRAERGGRRAERGGQRAEGGAQRAERRGRRAEGGARRAETEGRAWFCPLPSALCPLPSALCPLPSALCAPPSALRPPPSAIRGTIPHVIAPLLELIAKHWGYKTLRPLQEEAMLAALDSRDSLVVMPTGGGKSLCYQAPAVLQERVTVVVSPLISLMKDQVDGLIACGVPAAQMNSSLPLTELRAVERAVLRGEVKLLFVSPERMSVPFFRDLLRRTDVRTFAIDEAHCISHWGHDFRPEDRQLRTLRDEFPDASVHAYTATATPEVRLEEHTSELQSH